VSQGEIAIDFLLGPGLISRGISYFGQGANGWSHCASVIWDKEHGERYLDSRDNQIGDVPAGVHIREIKSEAWVKKRRASLHVSQADYDVWEAGLRAHISDSYDRYAILGFLEGKSMHTAGRYICSALGLNGVQHLCRGWTSASYLGAMMQRVGYVPFPLAVPAHQISPNACLLILDAAGFTIGPVQDAPEEL
jgi:hypothetical protein